MVAKGARRPAIVLLACFVLVCGVIGPGARAQEASTPAAEAARQASAKAVYDEANKAFKAKRLDEALAGFRSSYEILPSPNTRLMVVHVLVAQQRFPAAYREATITVEEATAAAAKDARYRRAVDAAQEELGELHAKVGLITVNVAGPAADDLTLMVGDQQVPRAAWGQPVPVEPGTHAVVLRSSGPAATTREVTVSAGQESTIAIDPPAGATGPGGVPTEAPEAESASPLAVAAYVTGGVGVAGLLLFTVFGATALSSYSDLEEQCPNDQCPPELEAEADTIRDQETVANVGLVVGGVGLTAAIALFIADAVSDDDGPSDEGEQSEQDVQVSVGPGSFGIMGRF